MNDIRQKRALLIEEARALTANEAMTNDEVTRFDSIESEIRELDNQITVAEERRNKFTTFSADLNKPATRAEKASPVLKYGRGDNEANAFSAFVRGDSSGVSHLMQGQELVYDLRAAVDSTMNVTTAADGGNLVPTGFSGVVATRKNELFLAPKIGVRRIPGTGLTVNYPIESADPEVFAATSEQADGHGNGYERNTVPTGVKAFTLAKKARKVELTEELVNDSGVNVMNYVADRIGREIAKTHNTALVAEVVANGTSFKSFAGAAAIAAGEIEAILGNSSLAYYLAEGGNASWILNPATDWAIKSITSNPRFYGDKMSGLLGYEVNQSNSVAAMGASAKSVLFGNWDFLGYREDPELRMIVDPYSVDGLVVVKYSVRIAYGVLQAGAVGYGVHAAS